MKHKLILSLVLIFTILLNACERENLTPKPPTYLKADLPEHSYHKENFPAPFSCDVSDLFTLKNTLRCDSNYCEQEIDMGRAINGSINLFYKRLANKDSLPSLINFSNKEVDFHKIKADKIDFDQIIDQENKVYGTIFELKGDVATNYQFYLTDSAQHFLRGEVILNCVPNYDSLRNVLVYIKEDLDVMMNTLSWKSK
jgi:gliding motility-associated lipoprotein GldD